MSAGDGRENEIKVRVDKGKPSEAKERGRGITAGGAITTEDDDLRVFLVVEIKQGPTLLALHSFSPSRALCACCC